MKSKLNYILFLACIFVSGMLFAQPDIDIVKQRVLSEILKGEANNYPRELDRQNKPYPKSKHRHVSHLWGLHI